MYSYGLSTSKENKREIFYLFIKQSVKPTISLSIKELKSHFLE